MSHERYFAEHFSWLHFYSSKKTTWQKKYEEIKEELAAALEQRDNCTALLQKMEEEHLETITKMKRLCLCHGGSCKGRHAPITARHKIIMGWGGGGGGGE